MVDKLHIQCPYILFLTIVVELEFVFSVKFILLKNILKVKSNFFI